MRLKMKKFSFLASGIWQLRDSRLHPLLAPHSWGPGAARWPCHWLGKQVFNQDQLGGEDQRGDEDQQLGDEDRPGDEDKHLVIKTN